MERRGHRSTESQRTLHQGHDLGEARVSGTVEESIINRLYKVKAARGTRARKGYKQVEYLTGATTSQRRGAPESRMEKEEV
jgi:hypothetical protein